MWTRPFRSLDRKLYGPPISHSTEFTTFTYEAGVVPWETGKRGALKIPSHSLKSQVTSRLRRRFEGAKGSHTASLLRRVAQGHLATEQFEGDRATTNRSS